MSYRVVLCIVFFFTANKLYSQYFNYKRSLSCFFGPSLPKGGQNDPLCFSFWTSFQFDRIFYWSLLGANINWFNIAAICNGSSAIQLLSSRARLIVILADSLENTASFEHGKVIAISNAANNRDGDLVTGQQIYGANVTSRQYKLTSPGSMDDEWPM